MADFKCLFYNNFKLFSDILTELDVNKQTKSKVISKEQIFPNNSSIPKSVFPKEVHNTLRTLKRRRRTWGRRGRRHRSRFRNRFGSQRKKLDTIFRKNHGKDLVFLFYTDYEVVDIQQKIKSLLMLSRMAPLNQKKLFRKEMFNAKININIKITNYDLEKGEIEYEFKKTKKTKFKNRIDCKKMTLK